MNNGNGSKGGKKPFELPAELAKLTVKDLPERIQKALTYTPRDQWSDIMTVICQNTFMQDVIRLIGVHFEVWRPSFASEISGRSQVSAVERDGTRNFYEDLGREIATRARRLARKANVREAINRNANKKLLERFGPKQQAPPPATPARPVPEKDIPTRRIGEPVA